MTSPWRPLALGRPLILGHRGTCRASAENTLRSFEGALLEGADGIECDVRLDADERVVVFHDATLTRMTSGRDKRRVETVPSRELDRVRLGDGERIPTLEDVLDWAQERRSWLNIEVKATLGRPATLIARVHQALQRAAPTMPVLVSSFDSRLLTQLRALQPNTRLGWLVDSVDCDESRASAWRHVGAEAVCAAFPLLSAERATSWRSAGALLAAWTVNDAGLAQRLATRGTDIIITDVPAKICQGFAANLP